MADGLGIRLVFGILASKSFDAMKKHKISDKDLFDEARNALQFVSQYLSQYGEYPSFQIVCERFGLDIPTETESAAYLSDCIRKRSLQNNLVSTLQEVSSLLESVNPDEAFVRLRNSIFEAREFHEGTDPSSFTANRLARFERYFHEKNTTELDGIPAPWPALQEATLGFGNGTLNVALAMTSTGKTWMSCVLADHCLLLNKKVLFVSMETPAGKIEKRLDAVHYKLPARPHMIHELEEKFEKEWKIRLDEEVGGDILTVDKRSVSSVSDILALSHEFSPDFVIVDGAYRLKSSGRSSWEATATVVRDLQLAAELTNVPWFCTSQMQIGPSDMSAGQRAGVSMKVSSIRYAKEFAIDPDVVIGLKQTADQRAEKVMEIHIMKIRDGFGSDAVEQFMIHWDPAAMNFTQYLDGVEDFAEAQEVSY